MQIEDPTIVKIAAYLKREINSITSEHLGIIAINSTKTYDAYNIPRHEFPVLKVFRSSDIYRPEVALMTSSIIARYCLTYPDQEKLMPLCTFVSQIIHHCLNDFHTKIGIEVLKDSRRAEYRVSENEAGQPVFAFLNFYFNIKESSTPRLILEKLKQQISG
jgi:hypothetical protein